MGTSHNVLKVNKESCPYRDIGFGVPYPDRAEVAMIGWHVRLSR